MKKKLLNLSLISFMGFTILPNQILANTFKDGETTYVLEEREIKCLENYEEVYLSGLDKNYDLVFNYGDELANLIKVNDKNECVEMTIQEKLDYLNLPFYYYRLNGANDIEEKDYEIIKDTMYYRAMGLLKTEDKEIDEDKTYYVLFFNEETNAMNGYSNVQEPIKEELDNYYEEIYFELSKSAEIDEKLTYYKQKDMIFEKVENPTKENILEYFIIAEVQEEVYEKVTTLDKDTFKSIIGKKQIDEVVKSKDEDKFYIMTGIENELGEDDFEFLFDVYNQDGEPIEELKNINYMQTYHNSLIGVTDDGIKIYNSNFELLYEFEDLYDLNEDGYNNYTHYMTSWDSKTDEYKYYTMKEYKVLKGNDKTFKDKDLTFKFSGDLEKVLKILVNNKELEKDNYTLESGSTIVTLNKKYLKSLKEGSYTLTVEYDDGITLSTNFEIEVKNPQTFDRINKYIEFSIIALIGLIVVISKFKKESKNN